MQSNVDLNFEMNIMPAEHLSGFMYWLIDGQ